MAKTESKKAIEIFESLGLKNWKFHEELGIDRTGQAIPIGVIDENGIKGVFRYLKNSHTQDIPRFYRELQVLTSKKFRHKNIVNLLAWTHDQENQWYISERGTSFEKFWLSEKEKQSDNPVALFNKAIEVLKKISSGLEAFHETGIVHRDIKPANVIMCEIDGVMEPVLIDFGVIYLPEEKRLTDVDEHLGNKHLSPDHQMQRMENPPPWLDVFMLSQLLIWMLQTIKRLWQRPLDWRFVQYHPNLPENHILFLRAITATCSEQTLSPATASELLTLINNILPTTFSIPEDANAEDRKNKVVAEGTARRNLRLAEDAALIDKGFAMFQIVLNPLMDELNKLLDNLSESFQIRRNISEIGAGDFKDKFDSLKRGRNNFQSPIVVLVIREESGFHINLNIYSNYPLESRTGPGLSETRNIFSLILERPALYGVPGHELPRRYYELFLESSGEIQLKDENSILIRVTSIGDFLALLKDLIIDPKAWRYISER